VDIQALIKNVGGTIETYFLDRQVTTCTVSLYTSTGTKKVDTASATCDTTSTTTSAIAEAGDDTLTLTSASGVVEGRQYLLGGTDGSEPREVVTAKSISGTVVTLWGALNYDHATGTTFKGLRVSYAVSSSACDTLFWDGWADFIPSSGDVNTEIVYCVLRKIPDDLIGEPDIMMVFPSGREMLDTGIDLPRALREARDQFLFDLGGKNRAHTVLGASVFRRPCAIKFWLLRRHTMGDEWQKTMDVLKDEYETLVTKIIEQAPVDADQDGSTSGVNDGGFTMVRLDRA